MTVTNLNADPTQIEINLTASSDAPLGQQQFSVVTTEGAAYFTIEVQPKLPSLLISPLPFAIPDDGTIRPALLRLSNQDVIDRVITLSIDRTDIVELVGEQTLTIPVGETETIFHVRGLMGGLARITLSSPGLETSSFAIYSTAEYGSISTANSSVLGIVRESNVDSDFSIGPFKSAQVSIIKGAYVDNTAPRAVSVGAQNVPVRVYGDGLNTVTGIGLYPSDGITIQSLSVNPNGQSLTFEMSVNSDAAIGYRRLVFESSSPIASVSNYADKVFIADVLPVIDSIDPYFVVKGTERQELLIRGSMLKDASAVRITPQQGITIGSVKSVNDDGTELRVEIAVDSGAASGRRLVQVLTPSGESADVMSAHNTLEVVSQVASVHSPVITPALGVVKGVYVPPAYLSSNAFTPILGIVHGNAVERLSPARGQVGSNVNVRVDGFGLDSSMTVSLLPADGVTANVIAAASDGSNLDLSLTIATDAPQAKRRILVTQSDGTEVAFTDPANAVFHVTGALPVIDSMSPHAIKIGNPPVSVRIVGQNLQEATGVSITPGDGVNIGEIQSSLDGDYLDVIIEASQGAQAGDRILHVETPAGSTVGQQNAANTLVLYSISGGEVPTLVSAQLGVVVDKEVSNIQQIDTLISASVGVVVEQVPQPAAPLFALSSVVNVVKGPVAIDLSVDQPLITGDSGVLTITGSGLSVVDGVAVVPADDVSIGSPVVSVDGNQAIVPITIHSGAQPGSRAIKLVAGDMPVPFVPGRNGLVEVGSFVSTFDSITPILGDRGTVINLTIRGQDIDHLKRVFAEPATGLIFSSEFSVNADGTEALTQFYIEDDAPVGARVIRVETAAGLSSAESRANNTFTVY